MSVKITVSDELAREMRKLKKEKTIIKIPVLIAQIDKESGAEELIANYKGIRMVVPKSELDHNIQYKSIVHFVGTEIGVIVLSFDRETGTAICSRAQAQKISQPKIIEALERGEILEGIISNILPYGAYVDIEGVTGLLKNFDFSSDSTLVGEVLHVGDKIRVHMKNYSKNGNLVLEAHNKYMSPNAVNPETIQVGQIVFGVIRSRKPFGYFVNIAPGLDVLTSSDLEEEIREEQKVQIKVLKVTRNTKGEVRVRGVIKRVL